jgi:hypothetical protein
LRAAALLPCAAARLAGMVQQEDPADLYRTIAQRRADEAPRR